MESLPGGDALEAARLPRPGHGVSTEGLYRKGIAKDVNDIGQGPAGRRTCTHPHAIPGTQPPRPYPGRHGPSHL